MSAQNQPATASAPCSPVSSGASGSMSPTYITGHSGIGKSGFLKALFNQAFNPGAPAHYNPYSLHIAESEFLDMLFEGLEISSATPDFSSATAAVATQTAWSDLDFRQRLAEQLERDAEKIRKSCTVVRNPSQPRTINYSTPDERMAITRLVCGG